MLGLTRIDRRGRFQEIVFSSADRAESMRISRALEAGALRPLGPRVYTTNLKDPPAIVARRNWSELAAKLFPGAVIGYRTAIEGVPTKDGVVCLTWPKTRRTISDYPGLAFRLFQGPGAIDGDQHFVGTLVMASKARAYLENLVPTRSRDGLSTGALGQKEVEARLDRELRIHGRDRLVEIREHARRIKDALGRDREFAIFDRIVGMIVGTQQGEPISEVLRARMRQQAFDPECVARLDRLREYVRSCDFPSIPDRAASGPAWSNFAFFEAYFSNYIEGTEFEVEEARQIVFEDLIPDHRSEDAHDVIGTFRVVADQIEMSRSANNITEFVQLLKSRHHTIMAEREDKRPGEFKDRANRAGAVDFVQPELVTGTLLKGFEMLGDLNNPFSRALFVKFLIADVHPFVDGNGRTARIMMNAELVRTGQSRVIIPTVYRDNYISSLAAFQHHDEVQKYARVMEYAREFSAAIAFWDYTTAEASLASCNAFAKPSEKRLLLPPSVTFTGTEPNTESVSTNDLPM